MESVYYHPKHYKEVIRKSNRESKQYKEWRKHIVIRDNRQCIECGSKTNLHAHHIERYSDQIYSRLHKGNGITLCSRCHAKRHPWMNNEKPAHRLRKKKVTETAEADRACMG